MRGSQLDRGPHLPGWPGPLLSRLTGEDVSLSAGTASPTSLRSAILARSLARSAAASSRRFITS